MRRLLLAAAAVVSLRAQVLQDYYLLELSAPPAARVATHLRADQRTAIRTDQQRVRRIVESNGAEVLDSFDLVSNALVVRSSSTAGVLSATPGVKRVYPVRLYAPTLDHSIPLHKIADAWQQIGGMDRAGAGVKIAIIDTGIAANHPAFQDPSLSAPAGFPKTQAGTDPSAYTNGKVIVARSYTNPNTRRAYSPQDIVGHGTGVATVAAGVLTTAPLAAISGVAPKAWIGNYKVFPDDSSTAPSSLIIRAIEDAVSDGMDVLNLSLGSLPAPRPEDDPLVTAIENASAAGKIVVVAAGNAGPDLNTISTPGTAPSAITAGSLWNDRMFAAKIAFAGAELPSVAGNGTNSALPVTGQLADATAADGSGLACGALPRDSLKGAIAVILRGSCTFAIKLNNAAAAGAIAAVIYARPEAPDAPNMEVSGATLPAMSVSYDNGTALLAAARGSASATLDFAIGPVAATWQRISDFSGRGPASDLSIKPDLLAVGQNVYMAQPQTATGGAYVVRSGTSFSSPTVAGAAALLMSARPGLTAAQYRSLLVNNSTSVFPSGAGVLNMTAAVNGTVAVSPPSLSLFAKSRALSITNVGPTPDTFSVSTVASAPGPAPAAFPNTIELPPGGSAPVSVQFDAAGLSAGAYGGYFEIRGTQWQSVARVPYWFAVPSQTAASIQVFNAPASVSMGFTFTLHIRAIDGAGLAITDGITKEIVKAGNVVSVESTDANSPGTYEVVLLAPMTAGNFVVRFELGGVVKEVTIAAV